MSNIMLVCGGRKFTNRDMILAAMDEAFYIFGGCHAVVTGGAPGVDTIAHEIAQDSGIVSKQYFANWKKHGRRAGPIRNQQMLDSEDITYAVVMPGGRGTSDMRKRLDDNKIPYLLAQYTTTLRNVDG